MKVLFLIHSFFPDEDANTNVTYPFINELKKHFDVDIFTENHGNHPKEDIYDGMKVYRYSFLRPPFSMIQCYKYTIPVLFPKIDSVITYLIGKLLFPLTNLFPNTINKTLRRLIKKEKYAAIITVSAPVYTHGIAYSIRRLLKRKNVRWIQLIEDPHSEFIGYAYIRETLKSYEREYYKYADLIFTFPQIIDNTKDILNEFKEKLHTVNYPNFSVCSHNTGKKIKKTPGKINFLYVGSLQNVYIRNPENYFKTINKIEDSQFCFDFVVNNWDETNMALRDKFLSNKQNVMFYPRMPLEDCLSFMNESNILVNIGNSCVNQVPSKIFDYISAGKPIINFLNSPNDPCVKILENYPAVLNIFPDENIDEIVNKVTCFAIQNADSVISETELMEIFDCYTPETAAKPFVEEILRITPKDFLND